MTYSSNKTNYMIAAKKVSWLTNTK
jgi:hypothetical protein